MGIYARVINYDDMFNNLPFTPVMLNDFNTSIPEEKDALDRQMYTHYKDQNTIDEAASCDCGEITGVYNLGIHCDICNTTVQGTTDRPIQSTLWVRAPEGITALISPACWMILEPALKVKDFNFLEYLTSHKKIDTDRITSKETRKKLDKFLAWNPPRGINNFIAHFDAIMEFVFQNGIVDPNKANKAELWEFIQQNKGSFFPKQLPIPSRICFVVESTTSGIYIDSPLKLAMEAVLTMASVRSTSYPLSIKQIENRVAKAISELSKFYDTYTKERIAKKPGAIRRDALGSRLNFSARAVITSISDPHDFDEIHLPWGLAAQLFKYHIINKLLKRGYTANQALEFVYSNVLKYNADLDVIFRELIDEAPKETINGKVYGGPRCTFSRNPTLQRGSMQFLRITKVKTDPTVNTISMSVGILKSPNAD